MFLACFYCWVNFHYWRDGCVWYFVRLINDLLHRLFQLHCVLRPSQFSHPSNVEVLSYFESYGNLICTSLFYGCVFLQKRKLEWLILWLRFFVSCGKKKFKNYFWFWSFFQQEIVINDREYYLWWFDGYFVQLDNILKKKCKNKYYYPKGLQKYLFACD